MPMRRSLAARSPSMRSAATCWARPSRSSRPRRSSILPIVHQALFEAVGRLSIRDLTGDQARGDLEATVSQALGSSLSREGLGFGRIQTLSVCHPEYDAHHCRTGETWLHRLDLEHQKETAKLEA